MAGTATLSHDFPTGPEILSPAEGSRVDAAGLVVSWSPVTEAAGLDSAGYQVLVVQEEPVVRVFSADLPPTATRLAGPVEFVQPRTDYKVEVLAVEAGGNQTLTEVSFHSR